MAFKSDYETQWFELNSVEGVFVKDRLGELHFPLTLFARQGQSHVSIKTLKEYLRQVVIFVCFAERERSQMLVDRKWDDSPECIRQTVRDYLVSELGCSVSDLPDGRQYIALKSAHRGKIKFLLPGLKLFYKIMIAWDLYHYDNPMVFLDIELEVDQEAVKTYPKMPEISGVAESPPIGRYSDAYYRLEEEVWVPQLIDDELFYNKLLETFSGCKKFSGLREQCIVRLLFETGARISEIMSLTLDDWLRLGAAGQADAQNKGSRGRRTKFISFTAELAILLKRYIDEERSLLDLEGYKLSDFRVLKDTRQSLKHHPLFLNRQGRAMSANHFRDHYWRPLCHECSLAVQIHQARHWYVTTSIRYIYKECKDKAEVDKAIEDLIEYMKWRRGMDVINAYNHYFDALRQNKRKEEMFADLNSKREAVLSNPDAMRRMGINKEKEIRKDESPDLSLLKKLGGIK